jgi:nicotinate-nucleotide--dimethylbenzimidazole phosphoribosyltransferase
MLLTEESIKKHIDALAKPIGSLGRWEDLAARLCWIQQTIAPVTAPAELVVFAADHGVIAEGVTLWPPQVTTVMVEQIACGGSVSAALSDAFGIGRRVVDVGTKVPPRIQHSRLASRRVRPGTGNLAIEPAMTLQEYHQLLEIGADEARMSYLRGSRVVILGEMGIGNTTSASCLARLLADVSLDLVVGSGAGATDASLFQKKRVVQDATDRVLERCGHDIDDTAIAAVGGLEIVAMSGFMVQAAKQQQLLLLDGMIATAAALIAEKKHPGTKDCMIAAHQSAEPSHGLMLQKLGLRPMLEWSMRLGEGTGGLALYPLLNGAAAWCRNTARIDELQLP